MLVRVAILLLTVALQAWSLEVDSAADEAPSLLQGAYQTLASAEAPVVVAEEKAENEFPNLDNVVKTVTQSHHLDDLHKHSIPENFDETEPGVKEWKTKDDEDGEDLSEMQSDFENSSKESYDGHDEDLHGGALEPQKVDELAGENATREPDSLSDSFSQLQHLDDLQEEAKEESDEGLHQTQLGALKPEKGDEMPSFPRSFPGCGCLYVEFSKKWECKGSIAHPASMQGTECCCCTLACDANNRCTNDQCTLIGIDQKAEIAAEEARLKALRKDADALLLNLPVYKVALGLGRPTGRKIEEACKDKKMIPLCDHWQYRNNGCYHPGEPKSAHFSVPHQLLPLGIDPRQFYGLANYQHRAGPHGGALFATGTSHSWTAIASSLTISDMTTKGTIQSIPISQIDQGKALGGWHTYCVKEQSNR